MAKKSGVRQIKVKVTPGAGRQEIRMLADDSFAAKIISPPLKNRANRELCEMLARHFGVPKSAVRVIHGHRARHKTIEIAQ